MKAQPVINPQHFKTAPIGETSYKIRHALNGWKETPPSSVYPLSLGINFTNVKPAHIDATMRHLDRNGIRHVRVDVSWVSLDENGNIINPSVLDTLRAVKKYGIRPLVLLNSHEGVPCPTKEVRVTLLRPVASGDRSIYVSHEDAQKINLFRTGFSHEKTDPSQPNGPYMAVNVMAIFKWDFGGGPGTQTRVDLSRPLYRDIPVGEIALTELLAAPLFTARPSSNTTSSLLMPIQLDTLHKWIGSYVKPLGKQLDEIMGKGRWDCEVGNELMFGAAWFLGGRDYLDEAALDQLKWTLGFSLLNEVVKRTVDYIHANHPGTETVNGFTSQNIWTTAGGEVTTERHSRHFYVPYATHEGMNFWYPEQTSSSDYDGINSLYLDMLPFNHNQFGRNNHSWNMDGSKGPASVLTQTEGGSVTQYAVNAGMVLTDEEHMYLRAKWELRQTLWYAHKSGVNKDGRGSRYYMYTVREGDLINYHQIASPEFFAYLDKSGGVYPDLATEKSLTCKTFEVLDRTCQHLLVNPRIPASGARQLDINILSGGEGTVLIDGPHGPLTAKEMLTALPFQTSGDDFCVALYVQTVNLAKDYTGNPGPERLNLPEEEYALSINTNWGPTSSARVIDLMTGRSQSVHPQVDGSFKVMLTDYPKLLKLTNV